MLFCNHQGFHFVMIFIISYLSEDVASITNPEYYENFRKTHSCGKALFLCDSGECINEDNLCDGTVDCKDGSDETSDCINIIPCSSSFLFQCDYGACINKSQQCDGKPDCKDQSDETDKACGKCGVNHFKCGSGECIDKSTLCDGEADCRDSSDETQSECLNITCPLYSFRCQYGACINKKSICNGVTNCVDGSDEDQCDFSMKHSPFLGNGQFQCNSGECIDEEYVCDGVGNCLDFSDEASGLCSKFNCPRYSYRCKYGACVKRGARCNGVTECMDGSDEQDCNVPPPTVAPITAAPITVAPITAAPIAPTPKPVCLKDEFKCNSGKCIRDTLICNGKRDCLDGSDETYSFCSRRRCPSTALTCAYGACVSASARCNGVIDCLDGSDEHNCGAHIATTTTKPYTAPHTPPYIRPTTTIRPRQSTKSSSDSCVMPANVEHGMYQIGKQPAKTYKPGDLLPAYSVLVPRCNNGYSVSPPDESPLSICVDGSWVPPPYNCLRKCPTIKSTSNVDCKFNNKQLESCNNAVHGTIALIQCDPIRHQQSGVIKSLVQFCHDGAWDTPINQCIPNHEANNTFVNIFYIFKEKRK